MSITAKELAKKLNLSAAAVSMALNNKPGVSTQTRQQVMEAAQKYGYDFRRLAEKHSVTGSIYFVIYKKHGTVVTDTPFFSEVSGGISRYFQQQQIKLQITYIYEDDATLSRQIEDIRFSDCIGMILLGTEMAHEDLKPFLALDVPVVLLDAYFENASCNSVLINNVQGAYQAARYLIGSRKAQPGYLRSAYEIANFAERNSGFAKAIRSVGMSVSNCKIHFLTPSVEGAYADMLELIKSGEQLASCYFADNDLIAVGAMRAMKECGYKIPADIAVVGFDDMPLSSVVDPPLTTIHVPKHYMGEAAAQRLMLLLEDPGLPPVKTEILTTLVKRKSA